MGTVCHNVQLPSNWLPMLPLHYGLDGLSHSSPTNIYLHPVLQCPVKCQHFQKLMSIPMGDTNTLVYPGLTNMFGQYWRILALNRMLPEWSGVH